MFCVYTNTLQKQKDIIQEFYIQFTLYCIVIKKQEKRNKFKKKEEIFKLNKIYAAEYNNYNLLFLFTANPIKVLKTNLFKYKCPIANFI